MAGVEIRLADGSELKFNQSFLKFIVKKKIQLKSYDQFDCKCLNTRHC